MMPISMKRTPQYPRKIKFLLNVKSAYISYVSILPVVTLMTNARFHFSLQSITAQVLPLRGMRFIYFFSSISLYIQSEKHKIGINYMEWWASCSLCIGLHDGSRIHQAILYLLL